MGHIVPIDIFFLPCNYYQPTYTCIYLLQGESEIESEIEREREREREKEREREREREKDLISLQRRVLLLQQQQ